MRASVLVFLCATAVAVTVPITASAQILETETARPLGRHVFEYGMNFEYQRSAEGSESAMPFLLEYGLTNRMELALEPVALTRISPKVGTSARGAGDLEATLTYLVAHETAGRPAIAFAVEIKFPTARNRLIGTGGTDYAMYLIGSKFIGRLDLHANVGYTVVGKPGGAPLKNIFNFAVGGERRFGTAWSLYGEVLANTASSTLKETLNQVNPEAPTGELVGSLGLARYVNRNLRLSLGGSIDNNGAFMIRPGITVSLR